MAGKFTLPANGDPYQWDKLYQIGAAANGLSGWGRIWNLASLDDDSNYLLTLRNLGTGGHLRVLRSTDGAAILTQTDTTLTVIDTTINGGLTVNNNLVVKGSASLGDAAGDAHVIKGTLNVQHAVDFDSTLNVDGATTLTALTATGNVALGDANTDAHTVIGLTTFRNAAGSATQLYVDAANARVLVGTATALTTASDDLFTVAGGVGYFAGNSGPSIGLRYNAAQTVGWTLGVSAAGANADLVFKDDGGAETFRVGDTSSTYQATVTGSLGVTTDVAMTGSGARFRADFTNATLTNRAMFVTSTANSDTNIIALPNGTGTTGSWIAANNSTVASGQGFQLRGTTTRHRLASVDLGAGSTLPIGVYFGATQRFGFETDGSVVVSTNNVGYSGTESGGTVRNLAKVDGGNILQYGVSGATGSVVEAAYVQLKSNGTVRFSVDTTGLGFFGTAPSAKAAVTGAKGGNVALANLLTELAAKGLITDSTT